MNTWFVDFPTWQYQEDVCQLAKDNDLRIVDSRFDDGTGAKDVPKLTKKGVAGIAEARKSNKKAEPNNQGSEDADLGSDVQAEANQVRSPVKSKRGRPKKTNQEAR